MIFICFCESIFRWPLGELCLSDGAGVGEPLLK
ncbi:MAG: hypothetical protein ACI92G_002441, partial [Candidatus Pelagisphaera sp.]